MISNTHDASPTDYDYDHATPVINAMQTLIRAFNFFIFRFLILQIKSIALNTRRDEYMIYPVDENIACRVT